MPEGATRASLVVALLERCPPGRHVWLLGRDGARATMTTVKFRRAARFDAGTGADPPKGVPVVPAWARFACVEGDARWQTLPAGPSAGPTSSAT